MNKKMMNDIKMCGVENDEREMMSDMLRLSSRFTNSKICIIFCTIQKNI